MNAPADWPEGIEATAIGDDVSDVSGVVRIGRYEFPYTDLQHPGPILTKLAGADYYVAWVPLFCRGSIRDPHGVLRVVQEGDETRILDGVPDVPEPDGGPA